MLDIIVDFPGDPSVGIFSATWTISDIPEPSDAEEYEGVRSAFSAAFELVTGGGHRVYFSDEIKGCWPDKEPSEACDKHYSCDSANRVNVLSPNSGGTFMSVCADNAASDAEILQVCNDLCPVDAKGGWKKVFRIGGSAPCPDQLNRTHYLVSY